MSFGSTTCRLEGKYWIIDGNPHVKHRLVTCFPLAERKSDGKIFIPATPDQSRELMWFRGRYPMDVTPDSHMRKQCAEFMNRQSQAERILSKEYVAEPVKFAEGMAPRWYQSQAADLWKSVGSLLLADALGTGKTLSALAGIADPALRPACVVVPSNLDRQWVKVCNKFLPNLTTHIIKTMEPYDLATLAPCPVCQAMLDSKYVQRCPRCRFKVPEKRQVADMIICSYSKLEEWPDYLAEVCNSVVFEEAHSLRRDESKKWAAASVLASQVNFRLGLTATPLFNLGGEIWNIMECISPGFLGPKDAFKKNNCGYGQNGKEPPLNDPISMGEYLRESNVMLRRTAADVGIVKGQCNIIPYEIDASADAFAKHSGRAAELARLILNDAKLERGRAMQVAGEFDRELRKATGLAKVPAVSLFIELLLEQGIPVLAFAWHLDVHNALMEKLQKFNPVRYTGQESKSQKDDAFEKFTRGSDGGGTDLMIISLGAGEGLDGLQHRCCTTVFVELDWAWAKICQCIGRVDRDGQEEAVNAYIMRSDFGLDPVMSDILNIKKGQLLGLIGEVSGGPTRKIDQYQVLKTLARDYLSKKPATVGA